MAWWVIRISMIAYIVWCMLAEVLTELQGYRLPPAPTSVMAAPTVPKASLG